MHEFDSYLAQAVTYLCLQCVCRVLKPCPGAGDRINIQLYQILYSPYVYTV